MDKFLIVKHLHQKFLPIVEEKLRGELESSMEAIENMVRGRRERNCMLCTGHAAFRCEGCPLRLCGGCHTFLSGMCKLK